MIYPYAHLHLADGIACPHPGCLSHRSHPCEGCGRIAGRRAVAQQEDEPSYTNPFDVGGIMSSLNFTAPDTPSMPDTSMPDSSSSFDGFGGSDNGFGGGASSGDW